MTSSVSLQTVVYSASICHSPDSRSAMRILVLFRTTWPRDRWFEPRWPRDRWFEPRWPTGLFFSDPTLRNTQSIPRYYLTMLLITLQEKLELGLAREGSAASPNRGTAFTPSHRGDQVPSYMSLWPLWNGLSLKKAFNRVHTANNICIYFSFINSTNSMAQVPSKWPSDTAGRAPAATNSIA